PITIRRRSDTKFVISGIKRRKIAYEIKAQNTTSNTVAAATNVTGATNVLSDSSVNSQNTTLPVAGTNDDKNVNTNDDNNAIKTRAISATALSPKAN
ncbi:hypothetical protein ACNJUI_21210, partial [Mycobacterium tuberculosis]